MPRILSAILFSMLATIAWAETTADIAFDVAPGFVLETLLREPEIRQPLEIKFDERGRMWVVQYLQYPFPAGLKVVGHDRYWRIQYDKFPPPPPPDHIEGLDRITIFTDDDGDGHYQFHKDFVTGLNICTSVLPGRGGVWVLNPPYLLFYPDANRDDVPDSDPVVHLQGFGLEDLHAVANGLRWGPDGWLYGYQGSTTTAKVFRPGIDTEGLYFEGQNLWRYHPEDKRFELFSEGGNNNFGIGLDPKGRMFTGGNGGIIGFHHTQGGYYWKNWGKHGNLTNSYAFGFFDSMEDHSTRAKLSQSIVNYDAPNFPEEYRGRLITVRGLKRCISSARLETRGSTFAAFEDEQQLVATENEYFRPVGMTLGPDGALYIADWHDTNITWNVSAEANRTERETGRVYRLRYGTPERIESFDLGTATTDELIDTLHHPNKWFRETALRIFHDRKDASPIPKLRELFERSSGQLALEALWAINACGGFDDALAKRSLRHDDPYVRMWAIRLVGDLDVAPETVLDQLREMAATETRAEVRSQLASTIRRLPTADALPLLSAMLGVASDAEDPHLPLLQWWIVEEHLRRDREALLDWADRAMLSEATIVVDVILPRLARRLTIDHDPNDLEACAALLAATTDARHRQAMLDGISAGLGRTSSIDAPPALRRSIEDLLANDPENTELLSIASRLDHPTALNQAAKLLADDSTAESQRMALATFLGAERFLGAKPVLKRLFSDSDSTAMRRTALAALQNYGDAETGRFLLAALSDAGDMQARIAGVLVSRSDWALKLLLAVDTAIVPTSAIDRDLLANLAALNNETIDNLVAKHWGTVRQSDEDRRATVSAYNSTIGHGAGDSRRGIAVYDNLCAKCHVLHGVGRTVGPELTGIDRRNREKLLFEIVDPNRSVLPEYAASIFTLNEAGDERTITGFLTQENARETTLVDSAGNTLTVSNDSIISVEPMRISLMPEALLPDLSDQELRDLFAFLQSESAP